MTPPIRLFISSPGDVSEERGLAQQVIERLRVEFAGSVDLQPYFWEHEPLSAGAGFQDQIALPSEHDLVITILWSRIGTRLHPRFAKSADQDAPTGTEFEVEDALRSWREFRRPDILMFVCTAPVIGDLRAVETRSRIEQQQRVEEFIRRVLIEHPDIGLAAHHPYKAPWDFAEQLETKLRKWLERRLGESLTRSAAWHEAPYRGLAVFESHHQLIFCGRRRAISEVLARLKSLSERMSAWRSSAQEPAEEPRTGGSERYAESRMFLLVQGMSGNGKSSLIRAGVLPLLNVGAVEGVGAWRRAIVKPSDANGKVFLGLARALTQDANDSRERALPELLKAGQTVEELAQDLERHPGGALGRIKGALADIAESLQLLAGQVRLVVFVDQLEELFTDTRIGDAERKSYVAALDSLASGHQAWVIATLRSDFAHRCEELPLLADLRRGRVFELDKPDTASLIEMIEEPARLAGLRFEEREGQRLSQRILEDAEGNAEALPLLEFVLEQLYERRSEQGLLTHAAYESLGMLEGALVKAAEAAVAAAIQNGADGDKAFVRVMRELVGIDESGARTRRRVRQRQFADGSTERALIDALVSARLLSADRDEDDAPTVAVAHEALVNAQWPRLQSWLGEEAALLNQRRVLQQRAQDWLANHRDRGYLLSAGAPLQKAREVAEAGVALSNDEQQFVRQSIEAIRRRRNRATQGALLLAAILLSATAVYFQFQTARTIAASGVSFETNEDGLAVVFPASDQSFLQAIRVLPAQAEVAAADLADTGFDDAAATEIKAWRNLRKIELSRTKITDKGLAELSNLPSLHTINLRGMELTRSMLGALQQFPDLTELDLEQSIIMPGAFSNGQHFDRLEKLSLSEARFAPDELTLVATIPNLNSLNLSSLRLPRTALGRLVAARELKTLAMNWCALKKSALGEIGEISTLTTLDLFGSSIEDSDITGLAQLPRITNISLSETNVDDSACAVLGGMKSLTHLYLKNLPRISDNCIISLMPLRGLVALSVVEARISPAVLQRLQEFPDIEELYLGGVQIGKNNLGFLLSLPKLRVLTLPGTNLEDDSVEILSKIKSLETLDLSNNDISPEALLALEQSLPNLSAFRK